MIIFGWGSRVSHVESGRFSCLFCKVETNFHHLRHRRWMTLFFIPIIPLSEAQDSITCQNCQANIPMASFRPEAAVGTSTSRLSLAAIFGMLLGLLSLLTSCVFFFSFPVAIIAVILGHFALRDIHKHRPNVDGKWQAITALACGYPALLFSTLIGAVFIYGAFNPRSKPSSAEVAGDVSQGPSVSNRGSISELAVEAFKNAEYEIASKRDKAAGRGNSPEAIELANLFASRMNEVSDEVFTSSKRPLLQLSDGEYLTYCQLDKDRCCFLVHVPSYRNFTSDAKKALAEIAWAVAQSTTAGKLQGDAKLAVGLRGVLTYGDIMLGVAPASPDDEIKAYRSGEKEDLYVFFDRKNAALDKTQIVGNSFSSGKDSASSASTAERAANGDEMESKVGGKPAVSEEDPFAAVSSSPDGKIAADEMKAANEPDNPSVPSLDQSSTDQPASPAQRNRDGKSPSAGEAIAKASKEAEKKKIDFENKITVELENIIANPSWGFTSIAYSPDGKWFAIGKMDEKLLLMDKSSSNVMMELEKLSELGRVTTLAFSPAGDYLVAGGYNGQLIGWNVTDDGKLTNQQKLFRFESEVQHLITSPKYQFLMAASKKGTIAWQPYGSDSSQSRQLQEFNKDVHAIWLPSEGSEAMATDGSKLVKWSLRDGKISETRALDVKRAEYASFSRSGERLVLTDFNSVHLVDVTKKQAKRTVQLPRGEMVHSLKFHPDEKWFAIGMRAKVGIYDFDKGELIAYADPESIFYQKTIDFSADGNFLATTSETAQDAIRVFRLSDPVPGK